jgi:NAD+ diphosphatase
MLNLPAPYCPQCGAQAFQARDQKSLVCSRCGFSYFHNVAAAVGALIYCQGKLLLVERGLEPGKGLLDVPGGFVDYGESIEQALRRELYEELQLSAEQMVYVFSQPNTYLYKDVEYHTVDSFFLITLTHLPTLFFQESELSGYCWLSLEEIKPEMLAFVSLKMALKHLAELQVLPD